VFSDEKWFEKLTWILASRQEYVGLQVLGWEMCQPVVVLLGINMVLTHLIIQLGMTCVFFPLAC
jgi:hypothetical protein